MKKSTMPQRILGRLVLPLLLACLALPAQPARAQDTGYADAAGTYSQEELAQMLAPIALYPDALLSQVLMASTYPLEVIEADRWLRKNQGLEGEALDTALLDVDWDPSVKALCHFPGILDLMSERISETTNLGNAFLAQEGDVMNMVQQLRAEAYARGNLDSNDRQKVIVDNRTIIIEPADPRVVYVPYYDPLYVYGPWWYPAYPPYYWGPPGVYVSAGLFYWPGFTFSFVFGNWCYFDWPQHYIYIDVRHRPRYVRHDRWQDKPGPWHHAPLHRRGVAYRDPATAREYGQVPFRTRDFRRDVRGFPESGVTVRERDFRRDGRTGTVQPRTVERPATDRGTRQQQPAQPDRQRRQQPAQPDRQRRQQPVQPDRQRRQQPAQPDRQRQQLDQNRQEQLRSQQELRLREQADRDRQSRQMIERENQVRQSVEQKRQLRQQADQQRRALQQAESERQQRLRDNVFNRVDNGRSERQWSERGRTSRQGQGGDLRTGGSSGGGEQRGRFNRR
jgi:Protein of unknown function (DUF3300)